MYNYNFNDSNESIICIEKNVNIKIGQNYYFVDFVLTNVNVLIFYDINCNDILKSRLVQNIPQFELFFKIKIEELKHEINNDNFVLIVDNDKINCYDFDVSKFINIKSDKLQN